MVVDDDTQVCELLQDFLEQNNYSCLTAENGQDALKAVEDDQPDLILMDIHMPGISGIEATQKIRSFNTRLPIIALTAVTIDENLDDFYKAGFNEIIPKPFKTEEFFEKIYRTLQESQQLV